MRARGDNVCVQCRLDHLVVAADSLAQGAAWCQSVLGVPALPGGRHALMGTHNCLLNLSSPAFEACYLEIIAIDPQAPPPQRARWYGLDDPAQQARLRQEPMLIHAVLRSPNITMMRWGLVAGGLQPGDLLAAERQTPNGLLRWQILVRDDGAIDAGGTLPTLIAWEGAHPTDAMPASGVQLRSLRSRELPAAARDVLRWRGPKFVAPPAPLLVAELITPRGEVRLAGPSLS